MKRNFTKQPRNVMASSDADYKQLKKKISDDLWEAICKDIESINVEGVSMRKFYSDDWRADVSEILSDMDKLSSDVASYIVGRIEEGE